MKKILAAVGSAVVTVSMAACGGHNPVAAITASSSNITQSAVSPLGAHFNGSVTADQFVCWDDQISPPGTSGNVSVDQWELSHLGGKLSGWLVKDLQAAQKHNNSAQGLARASVRTLRDCNAKVPVPPGWSHQGPRQSG